jgi:hypothetical protein
MEQTQDTMEIAKKEIEQICQKYRISLVPVVIHHGDRTVSSIEIIPMQQQEGTDTVKID